MPPRSGLTICHVRVLFLLGLSLSLFGELSQLEGPPLPGYLRTWIRRASVSGILIWGRLGVGYAGLERGRNDFGLGGWRWRLRLAG